MNFRLPVPMNGKHKNAEGVITGARGINTTFE